MRNYLGVLLLSGVAVLAACAASDIATTTEQVMIAAGKDPEKAAAVGSGVGKAVGGAGSLLGLGQMTFEDERSVGDGIALRSFSAQGQLHPSTELQRYVNLVGKTVATSVPRELPYVFAVVDNDSPNAWAGPGGYVFVTSGAIEAMEDEAQLAGLLGHELAHVNRRHLLTMLNRDQLVEGISAIDTATSRKGGRLGNVLDKADDTLFVHGLDQKMEYEADIIGMEYAAAAGYDPAGLRRFLGDFQSHQPKAGGTLFTSTHPPLGSRIQRLDARLNGDLAGMDGAVQRDRFQKMKALLQ